MTDEQERKQQLEFEKMRMELGYEDMEVPNATSYYETTLVEINENNNNNNNHDELLEEPLSLLGRR